MSEFHRTFCSSCKTYCFFEDGVCIDCKEKPGVGVCFKCEGKIVFKDGYYYFSKDVMYCENCGKDIPQTNMVL